MNELRIIKLRNVTQLQKEKSIMFSLMQNLDKNLCIYKCMHVWVEYTGIEKI